MRGEETGKAIFLVHGSRRPQPVDARLRDGQLPQRRRLLFGDLPFQLKPEINMGKHIEVTFPGGKKVDATIDGMTVRTDQPADHGGEGTAPSPFDLFLCSLAACAGFYAIEFCTSRKLDTRGLAVTLDTERDPESKMFKKIRIDVTLPAEFPEKYRDSILRSVNLCAVKKHILSAPEFDVRVL